MVASAAELAPRVCLALLPLSLVFGPTTLVSALNFDSEEPYALLDMLCWEDEPCHKDHTEMMLRALADDLRREFPQAIDRDVSAECARCRRTDVQLTCYRTGTRIEHDFLSANSLKELGQRAFGKAPSSLCGDSLSYCWGNKTCTQNNTESLTAELSANVYESPNLSLECSACDSEKYNISCFNATCISCFYDDNLARMLYEGAEIWGRTTPQGETCEDVEFFMTTPLASMAFSHAWLLSLSLLMPFLLVALSV